MIRAVMTGKDLTTNALNWFKDDRGVRVESVLGGLRALAGFCAVHDVAGRVAEGCLKAEMPGVAIVDMKDGARFWFGNEINAHVVDNPHSIRSLTAGMAEKLGAAELPDLDGLFRRVAGALGTERFGVADLPPAHMPGDSAQSFAQEISPVAARVPGHFDLPRGQGPVAVALSIQEIMDMAKDQLDPALMARIVMEIAVPASKLDPKTVRAGQAAARPSSCDASPCVLGFGHRCIISEPRRCVVSPFLLPLPCPFPPWPIALPTSPRCSTVARSTRSTGRIGAK